MCWEDVKIGRDTSTKVTSFSTGAADAKILDANPFRYALILGAPSAGTVFYSTEVIGAGGQGLTLNTGATPLALNVKDHGDLVRHEWHARGDAGARVHTVIETILAGR